MLDWLADLQPRPQRDGSEPCDSDRDQRPAANCQQPTRRRPTVLETRFDRAERHCTDEISVGDNPASAGRNRQSGQKPGADCRQPRRHSGPRHEYDREGCPRHRGHKRHVNRRKKQASVQISCRQTQDERRRSRPGAIRQHAQWKQRGEAAQAGDEGQGVPNSQRVRRSP